MNTPSPPPQPRRKFPLQLDALGTVPMPAAKRKPTPTTPCPSPSALDPSALHKRMVERLQAAGLVHPAVIRSIAQVPRHCFVDAALVNQAYEDNSLPIGLGQTISKPSIVARMLELLHQGHYAQSSATLGATLEIGSGCGYQTALLARLARQLISVERLRPLYDKTLETLAPFKLSNLRLVYGDGMLGHPPNAPYHSIIAAAGGDAVPQAWLDQLAVGGRLVAPVQEPGRAGQVLLVIDKTEQGWSRSEYEAVNFVPLKSGKN
jgi:protein-L-isoaspartate(D-aspartate) O-methyltransferase